MKIIIYLTVFVLSVSFMALQACEEDEGPRVITEATPDTSDSSGTQNKLYIVDQTGKRWDITHAVENYGMNSKHFRFGLGPNAIRPINNPEFIVSGEEEFPASTGTFPILGVNFNGDPRAYPLRVLNSHEVVNDQSGTLYFAAVF